MPNRINLNRTEYDKLGIAETFDGDIEALRPWFAKQFHPDSGGRNAERMKEINSACDTLGNPEKRKKYDEELRRERANTRTEPAGEAKATSQQTRTSPPPPPPPPKPPPKPPPPPPRTTPRTPPPPKPSPPPPARPPSWSMRIWFLPAFIPFAGPTVSWTYAAITAGSRRFARWALLYGVLLAFYIVESATRSGSGGGSSAVGYEVFGLVVVAWWYFGPIVQVLRRRREVIDAMCSRGS